MTVQLENEIFFFLNCLKTIVQRIMQKQLFKDNHTQKLCKTSHIVRVSRNFSSLELQMNQSHSTTCEQ
jgi:hypothetical protein